MSDSKTKSKTMTGSASTPADTATEVVVCDTETAPSANPQTGTENGNGRVVSSAQSRKRRQQTEVNRLLTEAQAGGAVSLDLRCRGMKTIPQELLELTQLEYLYLEGNELACLPEDFFDRLSNLKWLDLRNNYLTALPSTYIGRHQCLQNLLLEGNQLRTLPLELGLVTTLNGLNIANNPLEFPPQEIIDGGTFTVLAFFRQILEAKSQGRVPTVLRIEDLKLRDSDYSDDSGDEWGSSTSSSRLRRHRSSSSHHGNPRSASSSYHGQLQMLHSRPSRFNLRDFSHLVGPVPMSAALHKPTSFHELRHSQLERSKRAGALGAQSKTSKVKAKSGRKKMALGQFSEQVSAQRVDEHYMEERRLARLRELKEKQDLLLQRRRDQDMLKDWRTEGRRMQQDKHRQRRIHGTIEFDEPAKQAPYAVASEHMRVPSNAERIAQDIKEKHEKMRRALSPNTRYQLEEARVARDQELEKKIKMHTLTMHERRKQPQGTPQEEMLAAKRELQVAEQLQQEIEARRKQLEYRFTAFTGDALPY